MEQIGKLFGQWLPNESAKKKRKPTERGELLKYFVKKLGFKCKNHKLYVDDCKDCKKQIAFVAFKLTGFKLPDLYFLKSICDDAENRGEAWSYRFNRSIKFREDFYKLYESKRN